MCGLFVCSSGQKFIKFIAVFKKPAFEVIGFLH